MYLSHIVCLIMKCHCIVYASFQMVKIYRISFIKSTLFARPPVSSEFGKQNMLKVSFSIRWLHNAMKFSEHIKEQFS